MKVIIDTNRIIAALVKNGISREIILLGNIEFISPEFTIKEVRKYKEEILKKSKLNRNEFYQFFKIILSKITIVPKEEYANFIKEADEIIGSIDKGDVPFVALALTIPNDGIWTDDKDFDRQNRIRIWKTIDLIKIFENLL